MDIKRSSDGPSTLSAPSSSLGGVHHIKSNTGKQVIAPSSNWMALKKNLPKEPPRIGKNAMKRRKLMVDSNNNNDDADKNKSNRSSFRSVDHSTSTPTTAPTSTSTSTTTTINPQNIQNVPGVTFLPIPSDTTGSTSHNHPRGLIDELRKMIAGVGVVRSDMMEPGNYLAIDCEMVGLGPLGSESSLARVSIVNFHGHIILDTFVLQRERVTDWRTWVSGVAPKDMENALPFEEVQKNVAKLVGGKVLIGHAVHNDTQALLLSHPAPLTRDTQTFPKLREAVKSKRPGLKKLTEVLLGVKIQSGGHSSVTDARATMALYRLFKGEWESIVRRQTEAFTTRTKGPSMISKGKSAVGGGDEDASEPASKKRKSEAEFPGGGRKNVSSGLSVIVRRNGVRIDPPGKARARRAGEVGAASSSSSAIGNAAASTGGITDAAGNWWE